MWSIAQVGLSPSGKGQALAFNDAAGTPLRNPSAPGLDLQVPEDVLVGEAAMRVRDLIREIGGIHDAKIMLEFPHIKKHYWGPTCGRVGTSAVAEGT